MVLSATSLRSWPARLRDRVPFAVEIAVAGAGILIAAFTYRLFSGQPESEKLFSPPLVALLLVANLLPWMSLLVLGGQRIARHRAARSDIGGGGQLHVRLVAVFSLIASVPIVLTVIAASLAFQSGVDYWVSDRARKAFADAMNIARESQRQIMSRWAREGMVMAGDLSGALRQTSFDSREFQQYFVQQTVYRNLEESILFSFTDKEGTQTLALVNPPQEQVFLKFATPALIKQVRQSGQPYVALARDRIQVLAAVPGSSEMYLYVGTSVNAAFLNQQVSSVSDVLANYQSLQANARLLQLKFNILLFVVVLLIVGTTVWIAIAVADRLVRPVGVLVGAARRVADGDLATRVPEGRVDDEVGILSSAFNQMTERLQQQTNALVGANAELESRRALIEAVMSGVSAGIISVDAGRQIRLLNSSAAVMLRVDQESVVGRPLETLAPELDAMVENGAREAIVQLGTAGEPRTLAVRMTRDEGGYVLTFDDITQQLLDQRRAAWSDVARRIAHEIKNPLTPIQLAAERLQRRYGKKIEGEDGSVFARLTDTIVRQVGDLRRMVDEFSSFARMPKPVFREESLVDIGRQAMFLHEVARPDIHFAMVHEDGPVPLVCDRRQLGQALTNVVKNAVEAIEARKGDALPPGAIRMTIARIGETGVRIEVVDNGIGLPPERDRIVEPYMTTRSRGTGLGLAIVKKIVEEHFGAIQFDDAPGGGTIVTLNFDATLLAGLPGDSPDATADEERSASKLAHIGMTRT